MTIYVVFSCIDLKILKIICQTFIVITLNKIMNFTTITHEIPPSYMWAIKELIIVNILFLTKGLLYGIVLMKTQKIPNPISLLKKTWNYITYYLCN